MDKDKLEETKQKEDVVSEETGAEENNGTYSDDKDTGFEINTVASEDALSDLLNGSQQAEEDDGSRSEEEMPLAKYAVDCDMCATRVFFETEDLEENGNLRCPNCGEEIEIDSAAMDYYLVEKPSEKAETEEVKYVVDCDGCNALVHFEQSEIDEEDNIICPQCGEKIHIDTEVLSAYEEVDIKKIKQKRKKRRKIFACVLGVILGLAVACSAVFFFGMKNVISVNGAKVDYKMYQIFYYSIAQQSASNGFDSSKSPAEQEYTLDDDAGDQYKTWDDFLKDETNKVLKTYYYIYSEVQNKGYKLSESGAKSIEEEIKKFDEYASQNHLSFEQFAKQTFGFEFSKEHYRTFCEVIQYYTEYYTKIMEPKVSKEALDKLYKESPEKFMYLSFRYYSMEVTKKLSEEEALEQAKDIASAKDGKEFTEKVKKYLTDEEKGNFDENTTIIKDCSVSQLTKDVLSEPSLKLLKDEKSEKGDYAYGVLNNKESGMHSVDVVLLEEPVHKNDDMLKQTLEYSEDFRNSVIDESMVKIGPGMIVRDIAMKVFK